MEGLTQGRARFGPFERPFEVHRLETAGPVLYGGTVGLGGLAIGNSGRATVARAKFNPGFPCAVFTCPAHDMWRPACAVGFDSDALR